jgi:hypothetical protein
MRCYEGGYPQPGVERLRKNPGEGEIHSLNG